MISSEREKKTYSSISTGAVTLTSLLMVMVTKTVLATVIVLIKLTLEIRLVKPTGIVTIYCNSVHKIVTIIVIVIETITVT
jgi:hypothetical protein